MYVGTLCRASVMRTRAGGSWINILDFGVIGDVMNLQDSDVTVLNRDCVSGVSMVICVSSIFT